MSRAPITVVMTTYFPDGMDGAMRVDTAKLTLASWKKHLKYDGEIRLHVADDGSPAHHLESFLAYASPWLDSSSGQERHGVGASLNSGFLAAFQTSPLVLYAVDDWELMDAFDLTPWADLLIDDPEVGMVRYFPHPWLTGTIQTFPQGWGMKLDRHHFAFGHRPALYHKRMIDAYGWFDEDVNAYDCEALYNTRFCGMAGPEIVLGLPSAWEPVPDSIELAHIDPTAG
jgi:hypothetical protein